MTAPTPPPDTDADPGAWTTRRLLQWTAALFERRDVDSPRLAAEMLLAHVLGMPRIKLYMEPDRPAAPDERARYRELVARAAAHEPVQYLVGAAWFFALEFEVGPGVLIPRPSTETLVEHVLQARRTMPDTPAPRVADIGTGSGAIAVSIAKNLPHAAVIATDVSDAALAVARRNADRHHVADRVECRAGSLYDPLAGETFDHLLSNPPYIPDGEWADVAPNVADHEPTGALRAGPDGLACLRPLIERAADHLRPGGELAFEFAAATRDAVVALAAAQPGLTDVRVLNDHEGLPRVLLARRTG